MTLASSAKILQEKVCDFLMFQSTHSPILLSLLFCAVPIQRSKSCRFQIKIHEIGQYFNRLYILKSSICFGSNLNIIMEMIIMKFQSHAHLISIHTVTDTITITDFTNKQTPRQTEGAYCQKPCCQMTDIIGTASTLYLFPLSVLQFLNISRT